VPEDPKSPKPVHREWDADTPQGDDDDHRERRRNPRAQTPRGGFQPLPEGRASATAAFHRIDELGRRFEEHAERDEKSLDDINMKLDAHGEVMSELRETAAATSASVGALSGELAHARNLQRIGTEAEAAKDVELVKLRRETIPWRYKMWIALFSTIAAALGALGAWLAK
jgi:hypothetical protein